MKRAVVVLSAGRTGTQFLARYFDANYDAILALHEPRPSWRLRLASNAVVAGVLSDDALRRIVAHARRGFAERARPYDLYLESNPFLYGCVPALLELWGEVEIVHVVRDPRTNIRSALNHGNAWGPKRVVAALVPHWLPDVARILGRSQPASLIERYAAQWCIVNRTILEQAPRAARYHRVRFEDLVDDRFSGLRGVCEFIGVPFVDGAEREARMAPAERINRSRSDRVGTWHEWSRADCRAVDALCRPLMREFGYGGEDAWAEKLDER